MYQSSALTSLRVLVAACGCAAITSAAVAQTAPATSANSSIRVAKAPATGVDRSKVCFVNNKFMDKPQIPVEVDNKTYYGCCQGCVVGLQTRRPLRFATDPLTGKEVDKATAFIAIDPAGDGKRVLYFESAATHAAFTKKQ